MSKRNRDAFIKAARKTGGLSLPVARRAAKGMESRLGREPKGIDVKKHPRIFKQVASAASATPVKSKRTSPGKAVSDKRKTPAPSAVAEPVIRSQSDFMRLTDDRSRQGMGERNASEIEFVSTPEYSKKGARPLQLQIHVMLPGGVRYTKKFLDSVAASWLRGEGVPSGAEVRAIAWNGGREVTESRKKRVAQRDFSRIPFTF